MSTGATWYPEHPYGYIRMDQTTTEKFKYWDIIPVINLFKHASIKNTYLMKIHHWILQNFSNIMCKFATICWHITLNIFETNTVTRELLTGQEIFKLVLGEIMFVTNMITFDILVDISILLWWLGLGN